MGRHGWSIHRGRWVIQPEGPGGNPLRGQVRHWVGEEVGMLCDMWGLYDVLESLGSRLKSINSTGLEICFVLSYLSRLLTTQAGLGKKSFQLFIVWKMYACGGQRITCVTQSLFLPHEFWGLNKDRLGGKCLYPANHLIGSFCSFWKPGLPLSYILIPLHKHFCFLFNTVGSIQGFLWGFL